MKSRQRALCLVIALAFVCLVSSQPIAYSDYLTEWSGSVPVLGITVHNYPHPVAALSCVTSEATIFCVGGLNGTSQTTRSTFSAPLSKLGIGNWTKLSDYPTGIAGQACATYSGYVYCVGGLQTAGSTTSNPQISSAVYFAPLAASGVGEWARAADYPFGVYDQSCATSGRYIYCVGGIASNSSSVSAVEYAQLSPSGIAGWKVAGSYPLKVSAESCSAYASRLYCVGGLNATSIAIDSVFSASLNGSEPGWTDEEAYPTPVAGQSCIVHYPGLYCVGGLNATSLATRSVFFSYINDTYLNWIGSVSYPVDIQSQSCVSYSSQIYCVGGYDGTQILGSAYFSSVGPVQAGHGTTSVTATGATSSPGAVFPYPLAYDLVLAGTASASIIIIARPAPKKRNTVEGPSQEG